MQHFFCSSWRFLAAAYTATKTDVNIMRKIKVILTHYLTVERIKQNVEKKKQQKNPTLPDNKQYDKKKSLTGHLSNSFKIPPNYFSNHGSP